MGLLELPLGHFLDSHLPPKVMGDAQFFGSYRGALHIADFCHLFFVEVPMPRDPGLPEERNTGNPEMVALLTALSQVHPPVPQFHREFEGPCGVSHMLNRSDRTQISTLLFSA